jgi:hypothetical protein
MSRWSSRLLLAGFAVLLAAGCERAKSSNPLSPSIAGPIAGVEIDVPQPLVPAASSQIPVDQQPITLTIQNASSNGVRPVQYIFELGTDATFTTKIFTKSGVEPGKDGRTSLTLPQSLNESRYYWRAKADDGANASEYSPPVSFQVYVPVIIQAPALREPGDGDTIASRRPSLVVANAQRTGPAGAMQYHFEAATDATFASKVFSVLVNEGTGETRYTASDDLAYATRYYWRVRALDPAHESPYSAIRSFVTPAAPVSALPAPSPTPAPPGPATIARDDINMGAATIMNSPLDLGHWPATTAITALDLRPTGVHIEFSKQDGPGRWPDVYPAGWDEPLQYTLGMCLNIGGQWYCSAVVQFWHGLDESGGGPSGYANNWFYAENRWGPMSGHQPAVGEMIGFFACSGNCRNTTGDNGSAVKERTNVVLVPMPDNGGASFRF